MQVEADLLQLRDDAVQLRAAPGVRQGPCQGGDGVLSAAAEQGIFRQLQLLVQYVSQGFPLPFLHGHQRLQQHHGVLAAQRLHKPLGLGGYGDAFLQQ